MADDTTFGIDPSDEYGNAQGKIAAEKLRKQQRLTDLLQNHLGKSETISPTQAFAASALALLPVIVGKHYAGTKGAALGAQAGGAGASSYLSGIKQQQDKEDKIGLYTANRAAEEIDDLSKQQNSLERTGLYFKAQEDLQSRLYGPDGLKTQTAIAVARSRNQAQAAIDPLAQSWFQKKVNGQTPTKEEEDAAVKNLALYDKGIRRSNEMQRIKGERISPPSKETKEAIRGSLTGINRLDQFLSRMDQVDPNLVSRPIAQVFKDTEQSAIKQDLDFYAGILQQANERGIMTTPDYERYKDYFSISATDTPKSVARRLTEFKKTLEDRMEVFLQVANAGGENVEGLKGLVNKRGAPISSSDRTPEEEAFYQQKKAEALARRSNG